MTTHARVEITRNGKRAAVLLAAEDFDALLETLDVLADADLVRQLSDSLAEAAQAVPAEQAYAEFRSRRSDDRSDDRG